MIPLATVRQRDDEPDAGVTQALVYPAIGTLLATGAVASLVCRAPDQPFGSWGALLMRAAGYVLLAGVAHAAAISVICRRYGDERQAPARWVMGGMWLPAALLPMTVLLAHAGSESAAAVLPAIAVMAVLFVRRAAPDVGRSANSPAPAGVAEGLLTYAAPPSLLRTLWPMVLVALMAETGAAMLESWQYALAGLLFGLGVTVVLWRTPLRARGRKPAEWVKRRTAVALLLTTVVLLPSLGGSRMAGMVGRFVGGPPFMPEATPPPMHEGGAMRGALSGVILTLPPKPKVTVVPPPPMGAMVVGGGTVTRRILPFDGAYWYFRSLEMRPRKDARMVRGDPTKVDIRSTDQAKLQMEAHQRVEPALETDCCSAIRVAVRNAEVRPGAIGLELVLASNAPTGAWRRSLGLVMVPSSMQPGRARAGVEEVLTFPMPTDLPRRAIDELTVAVVLPAGERSRSGAHVAIEHFELVGR